MKIRFLKNCSVCLTVCLSVLAMPQFAQATIVEIRTNSGNFQVNLFDKKTPKTVENFLGYINGTLTYTDPNDSTRTLLVDNYTDNIFHRLEKTDILKADGTLDKTDFFVLQAGEFKYIGRMTPAESVLKQMAVAKAVVNEAVYSNVKGTIAMAKLGNDPNSASRQWFINLDNNSTQLDGQNGGFTAFGQITTGTDKFGNPVNGMDVVNAIAQLKQFDFGGALTTLPLQDTYRAIDKINGIVPQKNDFALINEIVVINTNSDTADSLNPQPVLNTIIVDINKRNSRSRSSGSLGYLGLTLLLLLACAHRYKKQ